MGTGGGKEGSSREDGKRASEGSIEITSTTQHPFPGGITFSSTVAHSAYGRALGGADLPLYPRPPSSVGQKGDQMTGARLVRGLIPW